MQNSGNLGDITIASAGWSDRFAPTPSIVATGSTPNEANSSALPIPDRIRTPGVWTAPAETTTSRAPMRSPASVSTPTARPCSTTTRLTKVSGRIVRLARYLADARYPIAVEMRRRPSLFIAIGPTPTASGAFTSSLAGNPCWSAASIKAACVGTSSSSVHRRIEIGPASP